LVEEVISVVRLGAEPIAKEEAYTEDEGCYVYRRYSKFAKGDQEKIADKEGWSGSEPA
jgi:hypothetical protein